MRWLLRRRWRDPDLGSFAEHYSMTSSRDLLILILYELRRKSRDDAAMNRAADQLDASSSKLEDSRLANTPLNPNP